MSLFPKLKVFMQWWGEGLYASLPDALRKLFRSSLPRLILQMHGERQVQVHWQQDGKQQEQGAFSLDEASLFLSDMVPKRAQSKPYQVELQLDKPQALHLQHHFPEAVRENLTQVVGYQLDRLTPFTLEKVYYDAAVAQHDKFRKEILADIYIAPRQVVEHLTTQLQDLGIQEIHILSVAGAGNRVNLQGQQGIAQIQRWSMIPFYFFLTALVVSLIAPLAYKYRRLEQIETALADVRRASADQLNVREKLVAAEEALQFLEEKRKTSPVALDVVEKLSVDIPVDTWLDRLSLKGTTLEIRGESAKALSLIDTLEEAPEFSNVRFKSPVTRNKDNGHDDFHIEATVEVAHAQ
ncbi:MAG: hypothetical protein RI964_2674 [Pseudomonadota bacterium]|jgi:general secretion pathway protein L